MALSMDRYVRQEMIAALSKTSLGHTLATETEAQCRPSDCSGRGGFEETCERHGSYHDYAFYRHCDAYGNLIHLNVSM